MPTIFGLFEFHKVFSEMADAFAQAHFGTEEDQFLDGCERHQQLAQKVKPELGALKQMLVRYIRTQPDAVRFADELPSLVDDFTEIVNNYPSPMIHLGIIESAISERTFFHNRGDELLNRSRKALERLEHILMFCEPVQSQVDQQAQGDGPAATQPDAQGKEVKPTRTKKSHHQDDAQDKLIAALTKHHKYAEGSCLNAEPIGNNELARLAEVSRGAASKFFKSKFKGHANYKQHCRNTSTLIASLKMLNDDFSPHNLLGDSAASIPAPEEPEIDD